MTTTIYHNANLLTCNRAGARASAMAVTAGRIRAVGSAEQVRAAAAADATLVDMGGATLMPGLVDIHNHHELAGRALLFEVMFPPSLDFEGILALVRQAAETTSAGRWIVGESFGSNHLERMNTLVALKQLDDASLGRPVLLRDDSHHNRWCNSAAMKAAGIDEATQFTGAGGISKDAATGKLTGLFLEDATKLVDRPMEEINYADPALHRQAVEHAVGVLNSYGVTAFQDAQTFHGMLTALSELDRSGALNAWVVASLPLHVFMYLPGPVGIDLFKIKEQFRTRHVRPDFAKFVLDGVPMTRTSAMLEPYRAKPPAYNCCYRGGASMTLPQFARALAECERYGLAAKIHCTGDGSLRLALDGIEIVREFDGPARPNQLRHQIAHAVFLGDGDMERMARMQVVADLSPVLWYPGLFERAIRAEITDDVVDNMAPIRDFVESGVLIAGGTDWPVCPVPDLWDGMEGMVTRANPNGSGEDRLAPAQAIDVETAVHAYTLNGAQAMGLGSEVGSLEAGKSADFIVVDRDVMRVDPRKISKTQVLSTWFEGSKVYER